MFGPRQRHSIVVFAAVLSLLLVQCSQSPAPSATPAAPAAGPVRGGVLTMAVPADASTLQPLLVLDAISLSLSGYIYEPLLRREKGAFVPNMAESFAFSDDGLTLTMHLKRDLQWSDGRPLTSDDVMFSFQTRWNLPASQSFRTTFTSAEAPDAQTIVFHLAAPNCIALFDANLPVLPKHIFAGVDINNNPHNLKPPISSGPFILQEWAKDDHLTFVANDRFHRGRPNVDKLIIRIVKDMNVAAALLKTQEVDWSGVSASDWDSLKQTAFLRTIETFPNYVAMIFLSLNHAHPALSDLRVRQAIAYAIDKESMANAAYSGHARTLTGMALPTHWAFTADVPRYDHDTAKAVALLREAGWVAGANGVLAKDGKPLKLRLHYIPSIKEYERIAIITQDQLRAVGFDIEAIAEEWGAMVNRWSKTTDHDMMVFAYGSTDPNATMGLFTTGKNTCAYGNADVDRLWAQGAVVPGCRTEDRQKVYAEAQRILLADVAFVPLMMNSGLEAMNQRIENGWDETTSTSWPIEQWYIRPAR